MHFNVPQFIELEDKIAFRLSARQLGIFAIGGVVAFILWKVLSAGAFYFWALVVGGLTGAFAFYRPNGTSLGNFVFKGMLHIFRPRVLVWKKDKLQPTPVFEDKSAPEKTKEEKMVRVIKEEKLKKLSQLADNLDRRSGL
jgi:hypothetical protein